MTWQVGDLAVRVDKDKNGVGGAPPIGLVLPVDGIYVASGGEIGLVFYGYLGPRPRSGWAAEFFRKVHPDKHEQCEPEFVTLLKRVKVAASGTPTRRAETTGSVGEADGGPVPKADAK